MAILTYIQPLLGMALLIGLAGAVSKRRRNFLWQIAAADLALQIALALILPKLPGSQWAFA